MCEDDHSSNGQQSEPFDELELEVGDAIIVGGQSVVVVSIKGGEVVFEVGDGFAIDLPNDRERSPRPPR